MLSIENLSYSYGQTPVLQAINLQIETGEIICLLGESGSGKTTLLRLIAGLEEGYQGKIWLNGESLDNVPVHERGFGLMFQDFALFPHLNVEGNIAFGLKMRRIPKKEQSQVINEVLDMVGLKGYEMREINSLSGGQRQRVALARSLAPKPRLLMLDEPLASLDAGLRENLVQDLRQIIKQIGLTAIYVTHDQQEAYSIADRVAIMNKGKIEQIDSPENLYHHPKTPFIARFLGLGNLIPAEILRRYITVPANAEYFLVHPENLELDDKGQLRGIILEKIFQGDSYHLKVEIADGFILSLNLPSNRQIPEVNQEIRLSVNEKQLIPMSNP